MFRALILSFAVAFSSLSLVLPPPLFQPGPSPRAKKGATNRHPASREYDL